MIFLFLQAKKNLFYCAKAFEENKVMTEVSHKLTSVITLFSLNAFVCVESEKHFKRHGFRQLLL